MDETQLKIKEFLSRFFKSHDLQPAEDIFALGFVNSLLAMQLAVGLRRRRPRTSQLTISSDPFWRDLGRAHRRAPLAGSEADR